MPPRLKCRSDNCANTILPATAQANDGYCMPCVQKRLQAEREEFIRNNRREVDPYAGLTDVMEIIRVLHTPRPRDPLVIWREYPKTAEELCAGLDRDQGRRLMTIASDAMHAGQTNLAEDLARSLAVFTDFPLDEMLSAWLAQNHFWPPIVFRNAGPPIRDAIVAALASGHANADNALSALAWIGDDTVAKLFQQWEAHPPEWQKKLFVGPAAYAHQAGWELHQGTRRNLFYQMCWALRPASTSEADADAPVRVMNETSQTCPWCHRPLVHLVELDLTDSRFNFLGLSNQRRLPILTCDTCTAYGALMFSRLSADGTARLMEENTRPEWLPENLSSWQPSPWQGQGIRLERRRAIHAVDWGMNLKTSQLGGLPTWVQDTAYPACPDCRQTMMFAAQVDNAEFPRHEGIYYAFLCAPCRITATTYQQS